MRGLARKIERRFKESQHTEGSQEDEDRWYYIKEVIPDQVASIDLRRSLVSAVLQICVALVLRTNSNWANHAMMVPHAVYAVCSQVLLLKYGPIASGPET